MQYLVVYFSHPYCYLYGTLGTGEADTVRGQGREHFIVFQTTITFLAARL